jgi:hypothetical protein
MYASPCGLELRTELTVVIVVLNDQAPEYHVPVEGLSNHLHELRGMAQKLLDDAKLFLPEFRDEDSEDQHCRNSDTDSESEPEHSGQAVATVVRGTKELQWHMTSLMDLLPSIQHSLSSEERSREAARQVLPTESIHVSSAAEPYVSQIRDKFCRISLHLAERFGEANWQRFVRIREQMSRIGCAGERILEVKDAPLSSFVPVSKFHDSGLGTSNPARSPLAASVASHTSFLSNQTDGEKGTFRVPPTPSEVADGLPFVCSICGQVLKKISNRIEWKYASHPS